LAGEWCGAPLLRDLPDPSTRAFGAAVSERRISHLGVDADVVRGWIQTGCMAGVDWSALRCIVSPAPVERGPKAGPQMALWLMARASWRPTIEVRMAGTEVCAAGSLVQAQAPGVCASSSVGVGT
jgi:hypothetical protein